MSEQHERFEAELAAATFFSDLVGQFLRDALGDFRIDNTGTPGILVLRHPCGWSQEIIAGASLFGIVDGLVMPHRLDHRRAGNRP